MSLVCGEIFDLATHHFRDKVIHGVQSVCLFYPFLLPYSVGLSSCV